jgi:hypothetical protein
VDGHIQKTLKKLSDPPCLGEALKRVTIIIIFLEKIEQKGCTRKMTIAKGEDLYIQYDEHRRPRRAPQRRIDY